MPTVRISGATRDSTVRNDNRPWYVQAASYQDDGEGGVISPLKSKAIYPTAGVIGFDVESGIALYVTDPEGNRYLVTAPVEDTDLWELLEAAIAYPPDTSQQQLNSAVGQYVESNSAQFRTRAVPVDPDDPDTLYQWVDANGDEVGDPVELVDIVAVGWGAIEGMPAEVGAGGTKAEAREAIDAVGGSTVATAVDGQDTTVADGVLKAKNPTYIDPTAAPYNVKFDCVTYTTASMSSSSNSTQLTVTGYTFSSDDIGKHVKVVGAGSAGADLKTTIAGISSGKAVLDAACGTTVSNAVCIFGTDNMTALNALFDDLSNTARPRKLARTAVFPIGRALYFGTLIGPARGTVKSAAENWINYDMQYGRSAGSEELQGTVLYQGWDSNADGMRFRDVATGQHDWNGHLSGILVEQDLANTSGRGISFRNANGDPLCVIDGGTLNRVAVMGFANEGFEFPNGCITAVFRDLYAFGCGYLSCRNFTADTTSGSATLANVSSFTGLVSGDRLSGPGLPTDTIISVLNPGAGTITVNQIATATATGTAIQRAGDPGVRYVVHGAEAVKFDGLSGDQNSGGLIRLSGSGQVASVVLTNPKNEFGTNVYREPRLDVASPGAPSVPQGANLVVLDNMRNANVLVENPAHWADASSSVGGTYPNTLGRDIGALILNLNTGATPPVVTWFNAQVRLATGSGQAAGYVYRDNLSVTISPVNAALAPNGTNLPPARVFRQVSDANATVATLGGFVAWSTLTAARTATLPALSTVPAGYAVVLLDKSGSASGTVTITATPAGSDAIVGDTTINAPYGKLVLESDGTRWVGRGPAPGRLTQTVISAVTLTADRDRIVLIGAGGAPTLPTAVGNPFVYRFKNTHTASRTVATTSSQTIDGATTLVLPPGSAADVVSDGSNWVVL